MALKRVVLREGEFPSHCTGCRICELVCSFTHHTIFNPSLSRIRVTTDEAALIDFPVTCRHCADPTCLRVCPAQAISRNDQGVNRVESERCAGCGECVAACPYGAISIPPGEKMPLFCDLCGGAPQCVSYCPRGVLVCTEDEGDTFPGGGHVDRGRE